MIFSVEDRTEGQYALPSSIETEVRSYYQQSSVPQVEILFHVESKLRCAGPFGQHRGDHYHHGGHHGGRRDGTTLIHRAGCEMLLSAAHRTEVDIEFHVESVPR